MECHEFARLATVDHLQTPIRIRDQVVVDLVDPIVRDRRRRSVHLIVVGIDHIDGRRFARIRIVLVVILGNRRDLRRWTLQVHVILVIIVPIATVISTIPGSPTGRMRRRRTQSDIVMETSVNRVRRSGVFVPVRVDPCSALNDPWQVQLEGPTVFDGKRKPDEKLENDNNNAEDDCHEKYGHVEDLETVEKSDEYQ